jgi:hypothetical protein
MITWVLKAVGEEVNAMRGTTIIINIIVIITEEKQNVQL